MKNPFIVTGRYAGKEYFCDREKETAELISNVENWRNVVLISLRRMGKSGLISHLYHQDIIKKNYETFFIDVYDTTSLEELVLLLSKEITTRLQPHGMRLMENFLSVVTSIRVGFGTDPFTGLPEIDLSLGAISNPQKTLSQIFSFLEASDLPCIVAIDEFQQIAEYPEGKKTIATLRTLVQSCTKTRFIFAGSNRRMMTELFNSPSEPFFMSCTPVYLGPIDIDKYSIWVMEKFQNAGKPIDNECIRHIYRKFDGHTWFVQYVFNRLYETTDKDNPATISSAEEAVSYILDLNAPTFQEMFLKASKRQRNLLLAISKEGKTLSPTSTEFIERYKLKSASAIQGALTPLLKNETVSKTDGQYFITNRFFSLWLARRY